MIQYIYRHILLVGVTSIALRNPNIQETISLFTSTIEVSASIMMMMVPPELSRDIKFSAITSLEMCGLM